MIEISAGRELTDESGEALAVPVFEGLVWGPGADWIAAELGYWFDTYLDEEDFSGKLGEIVVVPTGERLPFQTLFLVGLGDDLDLEGLRQAAGSLGRRASRTVDLATTLHQVELEGAAGAVTEGVLLAQYRFDADRSAGNVNPGRRASARAAARPIPVSSNPPATNPRPAAEANS